MIYVQSYVRFCPNGRAVANGPVGPALAGIIIESVICLDIFFLKRTTHSRHECALCAFRG